ncbi:MAG: hypothetical protein ACLPTZ_04850, partial [Beijerinckiaceae bacterium]
FGKGRFRAIGPALKLDEEKSGGCAAFPAQSGLRRCAELIYASRSKLLESMTLLKISEISDVSIVILDRFNPKSSWQ